MTTGGSSTELQPTGTSEFDVAPNGLPRLLKDVPARGAMSLSEHLDTHGELPRAGRSGISSISGRRRDRRGALALIDRVEQAGLGGRGGGGFPTAKKMRAVAAARGKPIVVVNATEGEPASQKDRTLLEALPHLVLDGAALAARAVGAEEAILCVCESASTALRRASRALEERSQLAGSWPRIVLRATPAGYLVGQESALVSYLNDGPAKPTFTPPMPFERGVRRRPTLLNNAETLAHVALIARHGPRWFRALGLDAQPGSTLVTLSGPLAYPGVYEVEHGASISSLIEAAGGLRARVRAALLGGYAGTWIDSRELSGLALSSEHLAPHGASLGAGVVLLLSEHACPVAETARVVRWMAAQSAGQCGPCVHGLDALASSFEQVARGSAAGDPDARIEQLARLVTRRGACAHPDGSARFAASAAVCFAEEFADHARHGVCEACMRRPELPLPSPAHLAHVA